MAITVRHGHFGRFGRDDWRLWLGATVGGVLLIAGGFYFLRDDDGSGGATVARPATANSAPIGPVPLTGADMPARPAPVTSSVTSFGTGADSANVIYIVRDAEHLEQMRLAMYEADSLRAAEGLGPLNSEFIVVDEAAMGSFLAGMDEANAISAAQGVAPHRIVDLR